MCNRPTWCLQMPWRLKCSRLSQFSSVIKHIFMARSRQLVSFFAIGGFVSYEPYRLIISSLRHPVCYYACILTHWGRVMHICVSELTIIGSDNGLSPGRRQAIIWTIAGILLIGPLRTSFSEISIGIQTFSFKKMHLISSKGCTRYIISVASKLKYSFM